jgi:sec-independent protein translocase protein TatB
MFDVGFSELLLTAVVALLVLGPERLPKAARFAGLWVRRARAQWNSVKSEFERELADDDLRRSLRDTQASLREAQESLRNVGSGLRQQVEDARESVMRPLPAATAVAIEQSTDAGAAPAITPSQTDVSQPDLLRSQEEQSMHEPMPDPPPPEDDADPER